MKRLFALLLSLVMICSVFAACGGDGASSNGEKTDGGNSNNGPVDIGNFKNTDIYPLEGEHKLTMGVALDNADDAYLMQMMEEAVGVDLTYQMITDEQAPLLFINSADLPDMLFDAAAKFGLSMTQINEYGQAGLLIDYMEYLDQMPNLAKAYAEHPDLFDGVITLDGEVYTLPYYVFTLKGVNNLLYFREDHMKTAGWEAAPTTVDEFTQYLRDLKEHFGASDPEYIPFTVYTASDIGYNAQLSRFLFPSFGELMEAGIHVDASGENVVVGFATEQYKHYLSYLRSLMAEGLLDPDVYDAKDSLMKAFLNEGHTSVNTLMVYMPSSAFPSGNLDIIIPAPLKSEYNADTKWAMPTVARSWGGMINANTEDLDACLAYMDSFFATEDNPLDAEGQVFNLSFLWGKKGVDWNWKEQGEAYEVYDHEGFSTNAAWGVVNGYSGTPYSGILHVLDYEKGVVGFKATNVKENLVPHAVEVLRPESLPLTDDEHDIYADAWTDINKYVMEFQAAVLTGEKDVEAEWDTFISQLNEMGLQDVIDVYQAALDRYNERSE